jgi:hypothetical protein
MKTRRNSPFFFFWIAYWGVSLTFIANATRLPIVFVYTVVQSECSKGLPSYIRASLEQSLFTQPDCDTYVVTNLQECPRLGVALENITNLHIVDALSIRTNRTKSFLQVSNKIFVDEWESLWMTSALRFFILEDLMINRNWEELFHVEADNLLYGRITPILPTLRQSYPMAVTPLTHRLADMTASVFWVSKSVYLIQFNEFLLSIARNKPTGNERDHYIDFLRPLFPKTGGLFMDELTGMGVMLHSVNEMTMLAFYHKLHPTILRLLPVVPSLTDYSFPVHRHFPDISSFAPNDSLEGGGGVGPATGSVIWDSGSYGQYLGGTNKMKGTDRRFTDPLHVAGHAIRVAWGQVAMFCHPFLSPDCDYHNNNIHNNNNPAIHSPSPNPNTGDNNNKSTCRRYSAPFVRFSTGKKWIPLMNLHIHSKLTEEFKSVSCDNHQSGEILRVFHYADPKKYLRNPQKSPFQWN